MNIFCVSFLEDHVVHKKCTLPECKGTLFEHTLDTQQLDPFLWHQHKKGGVFLSL